MPTVDLRRGDCLAVLKKLAPGSVDLTVTSPPYDNLRTYNGSLTDWTPAKWQAIIAELYRVTKDGGVVVWVVGDATINGSETGTSFRQALHAMDCGFRLHDTMIYQKTGMTFPESNRYYPNFEFMFVWSKGAPRTAALIADRPNKSIGGVVRGTHRLPNGGMRANSGIGKIRGRYGARFNIWQMPNAGPERSEHPAVFPEALARDHIASWSNPGDTVLDPFLGSGTTGKMAVLADRNFIGIERDASYLAIARRRIAAAQQTPSEAGPIRLAA